ncbi:MAG: hypothetical protein ACJAXP_000043 [Alcanivorax sp.]|jgi:hypothetical protein
MWSTCSVDQKSIVPAILLLNMIHGAVSGKIPAPFCGAVCQAAM